MDDGEGIREDKYEGVRFFVHLLVSVTLEKREGACALFVQKTPDLVMVFQTRKNRVKLLLNF